MADELALTDLAALWTRRMDGDDSIDAAIESDVALMNFTAPVETQWRFIVLALAFAITDDALLHLAAGPLEHLLDHFGDQYIARVEEEARRSRKFARLLTGVLDHRISPKIWPRVAAIQNLQKRAGNGLTFSAAEPSQPGFSL